MSFLPLVRFWIWISVLASLAGWTLSALGQLNRVGYLVFAAFAAGAWLVSRSARTPRLGLRLRPGKVSWRFKHWFPAGFALLAFLVFLGGALYPPSNHTALTYRVPRVLQWLAAGQWHWIHTPNYRMNDRACGIEWLTAPLLLFTKSGRGLFLLNFVPFLLLPGLIFSVLTRLGVRSRAAWHWMWLLPTGYIFLLQGGSTTNDTFPTVYALAAVDFACRAWVSKRPADLGLSILSAALLTGAKASNLPLLLPWATLVGAVIVQALKSRPNIHPSSSSPLSSSSCSCSCSSSIPPAEFTLQGRLQGRGRALAFGLLLLAGAVSFLPTAALNVYYCGDWSGLKMEHAGMDMKNPFVGVWGNALIFLLDNFAPPFFPQAAWWNQNALNLLPHAIVAPMVTNFEQGFHLLWEMPTEDWVGLGFGLSVLILVSVWAGMRGAEPRTSAECGVRSAELRFPNTITLPPQRAEGERGRAREGGRAELPMRLKWVVLVACWMALLAYCMKTGMVTGARLIAPYYPLLLPLLLIAPAQAELVRRRWWRALALGVLLLAVPVLVLTPGRPLWPAQTILSKLLARYPGQRLLSRGLSVYTVYASRSDPLASVRALLPKGVSTIGYMATSDDMDISLWRPFFQRRVLHVLLTDSPEQIRQRHIEYLVVSGLNLAENHVALEDWLKRMGAELVSHTTATIKVVDGPQPWYLVRLRP